MHPELIITHTQLFIQQKALSWPILQQELEAILGPARRTQVKYSTIYTWDELGIYAYAKDKLVHTLALQYLPKSDFDFLPQQSFEGHCLLQAANLPNPLNAQTASLNTKEKECAWGRWTLDILDEKDTRCEIQFSCSENTPQSVPSTKYNWMPIDEEVIDFEDFNCKLAILQVLMYEKELIKPIFDVYEFVESYSARSININNEGFDIIPEVKRYFEQLQIPKTLAPKITRLYQDGGDDIYLMLCPLWSGEDGIFDIKNTTDLLQFPNLKEVSTLGDLPPKELQRLKACGIDVDFL